MIKRESFFSGRFPRREQGVVLFIALIVLVAMTLAGVAMVRSGDTGSIFAGNLAFRQQTVTAGDGGIQTAFTWLSAQTEAVLVNDDAANGYYSSVQNPDWFADASWAGGVTYTDTQGNSISYMIHRMCTDPNVVHNATQCARMAADASASTSGGSMRVGAPVYVGNPQLLYRITARIVGPRNTVSVVQSMVLMPSS